MVKNNRNNVLNQNMLIFIKNVNIKNPSGQCIENILLYKTYITGAYALNWTRES